MPVLGYVNISGLPSVGRISSAQPVPELDLESLSETRLHLGVVPKAIPGIANPLTVCLQQEFQAKGYDQVVYLLAPI